MADQTELYDLRVTVERIEGRSVCGLAVGAQDNFVACPDPDERTIMRIMRIERIGRRTMPTSDLT
jgi:hypothetical protein